MREEEKVEDQVTSTLKRIMLNKMMKRKQIEKGVGDDQKTWVAKDLDVTIKQEMFAKWRQVDEK